MEKSKIILLLQACQEAEIRRMEKFLLSPYYNQEEKILTLFRHLIKFHPDFNDIALNRRSVFQHVFPNQPFNDKQFGYLLSSLNQLAEKFLALQRVEQDPFQFRLALLDSLSQKKLFKAYQQIDRKLQRELDPMIEINSQHFLPKFQWSEIKEHHFERQRLRQFDTSIQVAADNLDRYYYLQRLILTCGMLDRKTIFQAEYQLNLSKEWIEHLEQKQFFQEPLIQLYYTIYLALNEEGAETHFIRLKAYLEKHTQSIAFNDLKDIYLFAINYCARKIRQGKDAYLKEALQLYQSGIEVGFLIENGLLSPWTFTNVVKLSLRLEHYDWIESFIPKYAPLLPKSFQENALHYNLAELYYYTHRYGQAQEHLNQVAYSDLNYYLGARVLLAKIYFELQEEEPLLSLIASFTIFLKRNKKISNTLKNTYLNFCRILFQLVRRSPTQMEKLKAKIESTELLTDRKWLMAIYHQLSPPTASK